MNMLSTTLRRTALPLGAAALVLSTAACSTQAQSAPPAPEPPHVKTVAAVRRDVPLETVFTGRVEPIERVELRAPCRSGPPGSGSRGPARRHAAATRGSGRCGLTIRGSLERRRAF